MPAKKRRAPAPPVTPGTVPAPLVPGVDLHRHLVWARAIARGVRADYRYVAGGQEEAELEATAYLALVERAVRFDPARVPAGGNADGLFRAYSGRAIRSECRREAIRLRNGGMYRTRREWEHASAVVVDGLPAPRHSHSTEAISGGDERDRDALTPVHCDTVLYRDLRRAEPEEEPDDDPEPVRCAHEPRLVVVNSADQGRAAPAGPPASGESGD